VLDLIERKAQGEEITIQAPAEAPREPTPDLMSALKASLEAVRAHDAEGDGAAKPRKAPAKKPAASKAPAAKASPGKRTGGGGSGKRAAAKPRAATKR
jgi:DNA end-binding protein Ku